MDVTGIRDMGSTPSQPDQAIQRLILPHSIYKSEHYRVESIKDFNWPSPYVKPEDLANNGFYCLKDLDKVQCAFCHVVLGEFDLGDVVKTEHKRQSPNCSFVKGKIYVIRNII
jgi:hypothetical protein